MVAGKWETLRLTDAGKSGTGPRDVGVQRSPDGVRVQHGAARCGQNCGHLVAGQHLPALLRDRGESIRVVPWMIWYERSCLFDQDRLALACKFRVTLFTVGSPRVLPLAEPPWHVDALSLTAMNETKTETTRQVARLPA